MKTPPHESMVIGRSASVIGALLLTLLPGWLVAGTSNSLIDISPDGKTLVSANRDNGTVSIVDLATHKVVAEVPVGHKPESVTFVGGGPLVAVTVYADDKILLVDTEDKKVVAEIPVFDEPYGIVSNADGSKLYATLEYPGQVVEIDVPARAIAKTFKAGEFPRGIALSERENRVYVSGYFNGTVLALDLQSGEVADRWDGLPADNLARQLVVHPTRAKAYLPHIRSRVRVNQGEGSIVPFLTVIDTKPGQDRRRNPIPMDSFYGTFDVANPWEAAISPDGKLFGVVFVGTDDMYVCDVVDDDYREIAFKKVLRLGKNPRAIRFSPDSRRFYVYDTLDFEVVEFDADSLRPTARIQVCENPLGDELLLGKVLFYSALQPMVGRRWISCASCHPDGDGDARTWQNPEGLRNTTALHGMAWTHPIHWSADRDEAQDFEHTIRSQLMQGKGLISGRVNPALEQANKGRSRELDALSAYSNSHKFGLSPHAKQGLSEATQRGKTLFYSKETGCATCHSGPFYSDSTPDRPFKLHDVGTGEDDKSEKMGPKYDTPTLLGLYRTAPYLHHGRAKTLEEVLTTLNPQDRHGHTSQLSKEQVADLVEFLKSLPYEDPDAAAQAAGMTKIER